MMQSPRRNLLRELTLLLVTALAIRPKNTIDNLARAPQAGRKSPRDSEQRARIAPPTQSVVRRA